MITDVEYEVAMAAWESACREQGLRREGARAAFLHKGEGPFAAEIHAFDRFPNPPKPTRPPKLREVTLAKESVTLFRVHPEHGLQTLVPGDRWRGWFSWTDGAVNREATEQLRDLLNRPTEEASGK